MSPREPGDPTEALRQRLERDPADRDAALALAGLLARRGETAAARALTEPLDPGDGRAAAPEAIALLAALDEQEGLAANAAARWERLLAYDVDHREARAQLARLRPALRPEVSTGAATALGGPTAPTLGAPEGVSVLRYEIVREIGRGATSTVYLARDRTLELEVALKVLHPQLAASHRTEACRRFFHEARVAAALRHPGVVAIYDLDEAARVLVMEHLPGGSVRDRLRTGMAPLEVLATARTLLAGLASVHARGIVHGDLTPRNVLLRRPGEAVLADFGNARLLETRAATWAGGTPRYLAPEQFRGAPSAPRTDLFAAGAVLWEALAGRPMREPGELAADRFGSAPLPAAVVDALPPEARPLAALVDALVDPDPARRPADAAAALARLHQPAP